MNDWFIVEKPWKKNNWLIWENTVLNRIYLSDCNDTINGFCLKNKSIEQCLNECTGECGAGYHIDFGNGKTICVPIRTDIHSSLNPAYRLRKQTIYPDLNHVKISTFINTEKYPFPPNAANVVFYQDLLTMTNTYNGYSLGKNINEEIKNESLIYMESGNDLNIQLLPTAISAIQIIQYQPVFFGDYIQLSIPRTSLVADISLNISNTLQWSSNLPTISGNDFSFRIMPINNTRKIGDILTYSDIFALIYSDNSVIILDKNYNYLVSSFDDFYDVTNNQDIINTFQFVSKMTGYYCENQQCKSVPIKDIQTSGQSGTYNGITVERQPGCWGMCKYKIPNKNSFYALSTKPTPPISYKIFLYVIGIIIMILSIIFFIIKYRKSRKSI